MHRLRNISGAQALLNHTSDGQQQMPLSFCHQQRFPPPFFFAMWYAPGMDKIIHSRWTGAVLGLTIALIIGAIWFWPKPAPSKLDPGWFYVMVDGAPGDRDAAEEFMMSIAKKHEKPCVSDPQRTCYRLRRGN